MTDPETHASRQRLQPVHAVLIVLLIGLLGYMAYSWTHLAASAAGEGPATQRSAAGTTPQEAQARSDGRGREGVNSSQDAYTSQNQSRQPPQERR